MLIQFILIIIIVLIVLRLVAKFKKKELGNRQFWGWLLVWLVAIAAVLEPNLTTILANRLGVGRGADLVIYLALIAAFYLMFRLLMRLEKMEKDITKIVRKIALKNEDKKEDE